MDMFLDIIFWIALFGLLIFLNPIIIGLIASPITAIGAALGKSFEPASMVGASAAATYITFVFIYMNIWFYFFGGNIPILFYVLSLVAAWFGSGSNEVEASAGNRLMMAGEVSMVLILMVIAIINGVSWF